MWGLILVRVHRFYPSEYVPPIPSRKTTLLVGSIGAQNGQGIKDEGKRVVAGRFGGQGPMRRANFRVGKVSRALMCVADMVDAGQKVTFDRDENGDCSTILDKATGTSTPIPRKNKIYAVKLHVPKVSPFTGRAAQRP